MLDSLPEEARQIYDNPDIILQNEQLTPAKDKNRAFVRNQKIALSDCLKSKKHDSMAYRAKYQFRLLQELIRCE